MTNTLSKAAVSYERIQEVLGIESGIRDLPGARDAPPFTGRIEFDHVTFGYDNDRPGPEGRQPPRRTRAGGRDRRTVRDGQEHDRQPGSALLRSDRRRIVKIDGHDIREFTLKSLRDQISFVLQDSLLFRGTIWENICYGRPDAEPEDTIRAAQLANAHDFIMACRTATARWSASAARRCPAASAGASPSRARSCATRRS